MDLHRRRVGAQALILTLDAAVAFVQSRRAAGATVVFTNGVFDLLHPGHARICRRRVREATC